MKVVLIALVCLSACKTYQFADTDFPEPIKDTTTKDTLEIRFGNDLNSGFNITLSDSLMMQIFDSLSDKIKQQYLIQDSIKHSKKVI